MKTINLLYFSYSLCIFLQGIAINISNLIVNIKSLEALNNLLL